MKMDYQISVRIDIPEPTLKAITLGYMRLLPMLLSDLFKTVLDVFAQHYMKLAKKPFCCECCGNTEEFIWKTREGKSTTLLSLFGMVRLAQQQVKCSRCGHRMYITRKLLGVEPGVKVPRETVMKLGLLGALTSFRVAQKIVWMFGWVLDRMTIWRVEEAFFKALQPAQLNALDAVLERQEREHQRLVKQWEQRLKRAQYEVQLAERQYNAVDPDNRLVAAELERRWENSLQELRKIQEDYERFLKRPGPSGLTPEIREQLQHICDTLPMLWPRLINSQKKELLRSLISDVIVQRIATDTVEVRIVWISGHCAICHARPPIRRERDVSGYDRMVTRIQTLWQQGLNNEDIAEQLSKEGFRSARSEVVSPKAVQKIRLRRHWYLNLHRSRNALQLNGFLTPRGLAARLGVERTWVYNRIYSRRINPTCVHRDPQSNIHLTWIEARKRFQLSNAYIQMARELGLNPKKLGGLANTKQEPWKLPLPDYIEELYFKHFKRIRPDSVRSIEQMVRDSNRKKAERRARKQAARLSQQSSEDSLPPQ